MQGDPLRPRTSLRGGPWPGERWPTRRRPGDILRVCGGVVVLVAASIAVHGAHPSVVEVNLFRLINELPGPAGAPLLGVMQLGALVAVPILAIGIFVVGRRRLALVVAVTGCAAWGAAKLIQYLVDEDPPQLRLSHVVLRDASHPGLAFPASHVAIVAALATVAAPYVRRSTARLGWLVVALVAVARIYVGLHLPMDVVGGLALGWIVGAAVSLVVGVPARGPTLNQLSGLLGELGLAPDRIEALSPAGDRHYCVTVDGRGVLVKTIDRNRPDQDWLYRLWRLAAFREIGRETSPTSPVQRVDREAHLTLLAERGGVRTPSLVATRWLGDQASLVVRRWVDAAPLDQVPVDALTDDVLVDAWRQLDLVHAVGIGHRSLRSDHVLVDPFGRTWLVGWGSAEETADIAEKEADIAEMAVTLASRVGCDRTVQAAIEVLGAERVSASLAHLQPLALGASVRHAAARSATLLSDLRHQVAAIDGREVPEALSPARVAASNLAPVVAVAVAVYLLLPRLAQSSTGISQLRAGRLPWLVAVAGASAMTYVMAATALTAASRQRLVLGRTIAVQLAGTCANRVTPAGLGAAAINIRYLELSGLDRPEAAATVAVTATSGFAVHSAAVVALALVLGHGGPALHVPVIDPDWPGVLALALVLGAAGWFIWVHRLHQPLFAWLKAGALGLAALIDHPGRGAVLLGASAGISLGYILALDAALLSFGVHLGLGPVAAVYLGSSAIGAVAPTPGGVGPFEAAVVTGLSAYGVAGGPAVAAVIAYRLITYWLPVAPGAVLLHLLRRSGTL